MCCCKSSSSKSAQTNVQENVRDNIQTTHPQIHASEGGGAAAADHSADEVGSSGDCCGRE